MQGLLLITLFASFANAQFVDTWINGTLFKSARKIPERWQKGRFPMSFIGELVLCPRCLSHWTSIPWLALLCWSQRIMPDPILWPAMWLATVAGTRLVFHLAGGDDVRGEDDPYAGVQPYQPPEPENASGERGSDDPGLNEGPGGDAAGSVGR